MGIAKAAAWQSPVVLTFSAGPNAALLTSPDVGIWLADADAELVWAAEIHATLGTDGSPVTADLVRCASAVAAASGTSLLSSTFNLKATINTRQLKSVSTGGLAAARLIYAGESLAINFAGVMTALTGVNITVVLNRIGRPTW